MKFPYSMLRDYVDTRLGADEVGDLLTMAGFELEGIEDVDGDRVLDIKVVSNRGDGLSVFGLSREVLAKDAESKPTSLYLRAADRFGATGATASQPYRWEASDRPSAANPAPVAVRIDTEDCTRYACLLLDNVSNGSAPDWIQTRLRQSGQRPISLLVDLTNYVMLELGQPLHAFDLGKLSGPAIVVRKARAGERLKTLDGNEHQLHGGQMMICDAEKPVAAAGIMGGEATEVDSGTTRVLLESAHFVNTSVRRTRKQLGLSTEASYRFERSVDPDGVVAALERFAELLSQVDGGKSRLPGVIDVYPDPQRRAAIELDLRRSEVLLGMPISPDEAIGYLERLGFGVAPHTIPTFLSVTPPSWRPDVARQEDLVEELGRIHGYEKIPEQLPSGTTIRGGTTGFEAWCDRIRESCVRAGFVQTISHSLRDRSPLDEHQSAPVEVRNPNSPEMAWLRGSMLPCLADNAKRNGGRDVQLFEIGRVFGRTGDEVAEGVALGFLSQGVFRQPDWLEQEPESAGFFSMKSVLEHVFAVGGLDIAFVTGGDPRFHPTRHAQIECGGGIHGVAGQIHPDIAGRLGLPEDAVLAEMRLDSLYEHHHAAPRLRPISRNPSVRRDVALLIDKSVPFASIDAALQDSIGEVLERKWLFDVYEGKGIPEGKHSLAIALQLRKHGSNFTDEEANQVLAKAVAALEGLGGIRR